MSAFRVAAVAISFLGIAYGWGRLQPVIEQATVMVPGAQALRDATDSVSNGLARIIFSISGLGSAGVSTPAGSGHYAGLTL